MMNIASKVKNYTSYSRNFATAADVFAGITRSKDTVYKAKLPPPSYGGRHIVSMLPGKSNYRTDWNH